MFDFNPEHKNLVAGTDEMPFLFNISRGQRKGSLIFHIKIGIYFYELRLMRVFQSSCSFKCVDKSCKAKSKMVLLDTDLISTKVQIRNNGKQKNLYFVDRENPKLLDVKNWRVIVDISAHRHSVACEVDFYKHLRREFRVEQTEKGIVVNKQVVPETFAEWKFVRPEFEDPKFNRITKLSENLEKKSIWQKLQYRNPDNVNKNMVPPKTKTILMPSAETTDSFSLNYEKFLQYDEKDQKIFFIDSELILLHKTKCYLDGTFFLLKNVPFSQVYILSIFFDSGTHTFRLTNVAILYTHSKLNMSENSIFKSPETIFKVDEMVKLSLDTKKF